MIPFEFVFNPNWWYREYGISFDQSFYLDPRRRNENDLLMRRALYERFEFGEPRPALRPILGSLYVAGGFVPPALFGAAIHFSEHEAPVAVPRDLTREEVLGLRVPDLESTWPMKQLLEHSQELSREFGYVLGDLNTDGVLNTALCLRGQQLFLDLYDDPDLACHLFSVVAETIAQLAERIRSVTGSSSISVNRSIVNVDPRIFVHANCSLQMISPHLYEKYLLPYEKLLAGRLTPYGVHHCGSNFEAFADYYRQLNGVFFDVGWGSDIAAARAALPDAFLNLRLSPMRMLSEKPDAIREDVRRMIKASGAPDRTGVCCINMDYGTPDGNVRAVVEELRLTADR
ncbi:MAG: hypothetical protein EHM61_25960 [Acidobacteria bacterium]|nr:MAG: hypothetical protein EHM61_25960 [Acidobacteriota bacterium]